MLRRIVLLPVFLFVATSFPASAASIFRIYGWPVEASDVVKDATGYHLRNARMVLSNYWPTENNLVFATMDLSPSGDLISCSPFLGGDEFGFNYPVLVKPTGFQFRKDGPFGAGLYVRGELTIENDDGSSELSDTAATHLTFPDYSIMVETEIQFDSAYATSGGPAYSFFMGWRLWTSRILSKSFAGFPGVVLREVSVQLPSSSLVMTFSELDLSPDGRLISTSDGGVRPGIDNPFSVQVDGWDLDIQDAELTRDGILSLDVRPQVPEGFPDMSWNIALASDGTRECRDELTGTGDWGLLSLNYEGAMFDMESLSMEELRISFPTDVAQGDLTIREARLHSDGTITGEFEPFRLGSQELSTLSHAQVDLSSMRFYSADSDQVLSLDREGRYSVQ